MLLPGLSLITRLGPQLLVAFADAAQAADPDLATALRSEADREARRGDPDDETDVSLLRVAALLADLRAAGPTTARAAERILIELASIGRRPQR